MTEELQKKAEDFIIDRYKIAECYREDNAETREYMRIDVHSQYEEEYQLYLDVIKEFENRIEGYKNQIFYKEKALDKVKRDRDRIVHRVTKDKKRLIRRNTELKAQIEKMKNCKNCKKLKKEKDGLLICTVGSFYTNVFGKNCDKWEIKENE